MKFGPASPADAIGGVTVHTLRQGSLVLKKGTTIGPAEVEALNKAGVAEIVVKNGSLKLGQEVLITGKATPAASFTVEEMQIDHKPVDLVSKGEFVGIKLPFTARAKDKVFLWSKKENQ